MVEKLRYCYDNFEESERLFSGSSISAVKNRTLGELFHIICVVSFQANSESIREIIFPAYVLLIENHQEICCNICSE